jgi:hypothetical protein
MVITYHYTIIRKVNTGAAAASSPLLLVKEKSHQVI